MATTRYKASLRCWSTHPHDQYAHCSLLREHTGDHYSITWELWWPRSPTGTVTVIPQQKNVEGNPLF